MYCQPRVQIEYPASRLKKKYNHQVHVVYADVAQTGLSFVKRKLAIFYNKIQPIDFFLQNCLTLIMNSSFPAIVLIIVR